MLVHCASGGRSATACHLLARHGYTRLLNLVGGMHGWPGPREGGRKASVAPPGTPVGASISHRGGPIDAQRVIAALRECFDPEIPLNIYDLGLIYAVDIDESAIAVKMTLTSEGCPSARTIPLNVKEKIVALGQPNVAVEVVWDPPWHPSRISATGKETLGLT
jgi:metal-sulfur cluster biosynthetic enzyme